MAASEGPFGGYAACTNPISAAAQAEVLEEIDKLIALIPNPDTDVGVLPATYPEFDVIAPVAAKQLRVELAALKTAIDATPTS